MLLTISAMMVSVMPFVGLLLMWLVLSAQLFFTYYTDLNESYRDTTPVTPANHTRLEVLEPLQMMIDTTLAAYDYEGVGRYEETLYMLLVAFNLMMLSILLLNYLIAILSEAYGRMLEKGAFLFKCMQYNYCERFIFAF